MNEHLQLAIEQNPGNGYLRYHAPRYDRLLHLLQENRGRVSRVLDVGRSPFTPLAFRSLDVPVDNLGFDPDGATETGSNYQFDLNDSIDREKWRSDLPQYDIIVFAEVIEHLYTSPSLVLKFLKTLMSESGLLIVQTPNAVVAHKRLQLLCGRNPYSLISEDQWEPAHYREYTAAELSRYLVQAGFEVKESSFENYFDYRFTGHGQGDNTERRSLKLINTIYSMLPGSLRPGLCFVAAHQSPNS